MQPSVIAPSILAADFARLGEDVDKVLQAGADWVHFDVMDQHYVPNLTFGSMVCQALRDYGIQAPIDVHLMVQPVDALIESFAKAGASHITFHPEASLHLHRSLQLIKSFGLTAGLALNPGTPFGLIEDVLPMLDLVLLMSVNPGFGGQSLIPETLDKAKKVRQALDQQSHPIRLQMDGGVTVDNIAQVHQSGVDTFVAGSAIFNAPDYQEAIQKMRKNLG